MKNLKKRFKAFINDESGMEFMQVAVIVLGALALIIAVWSIYDRINDELSEVPNEIDLRKRQ